jgi:hypothetical protein
MVILPQGDLFAEGTAISGSKPHGKTYKYCPYSTQITDYNQDSRVPQAQKTFHSETGGRLYTYSLGGVIGWVCPDNDCSFFTGTAVIEVEQHGRKFVSTTDCAVTEEQLSTLSGSVQHLTQNRTIVSGTRYMEI